MNPVFSVIFSFKIVKKFFFSDFSFFSHSQLKIILKIQPPFFLQFFCFEFIEFQLENAENCEKSKKIFLSDSRFSDVKKIAHRSPIHKSPTNSSPHHSHRLKHCVARLGDRRWVAIGQLAVSTGSLVPWRLFRGLEARVNDGGGGSTWQWSGGYCRVGGGRRRSRIREVQIGEDDWKKERNFEIRDSEDFRRL